MLVKICGIKIKSAAVASSKYGADFLGFNFVPSSKRKITAKVAKTIISSLPKTNRPMTVGVFMDQPAGDIHRVLGKARLDMLQFHGQETPKFCQSFGLPYIKAFGIGRKMSIAKISNDMAEYKARHFLLDRPKQGRGKPIDLKKVSQLAEKFPIILAGGLTPKNVQRMIAKAGKIKGVDVAGGVEIGGRKDSGKIRQFIFFAKKRTQATAK